MTDKKPKPKPSIRGIGRVETDLWGSVHIYGWGIGGCAEMCPCHVSPVDHKQHLLSDTKRGLLGLISYRDDECPCCEPWTAKELNRIVRDVKWAEDWVLEEDVA